MAGGEIFAEWALSHPKVDHKSQYQDACHFWRIIGSSSCASQFHHASRMRSPKTSSAPMRARRHFDTVMVRDTWAAIPC